MDEWGRPINAAIFFFGFLAGLTAFVLWKSSQKKKSNIARSEFWIYFEGEKLPPSERVMSYLMALKGMTSAEGLYFSDIRLHIALVKRSKNVSLFRPDLFHANVEVDGAALSQLSECHSLVRISFVSEAPLVNRNYLKFMLGLARTYAELLDGKAIYDHNRSMLLTVQALPNATIGMAENLRIIKQTAPEGLVFLTSGLVGIQLPELETLPVPESERTNVEAIFNLLVEQIWNEGSVPQTAEFVHYDQLFRAEISAKNKVQISRIKR